jgi:hypothetical protein
MCPDMKKFGTCPKGDGCSYSHNSFELWLHPSRWVCTRTCPPPAAAEVAAAAGPEEAGCSACNSTPLYLTAMQLIPPVADSACLYQFPLTGIYVCPNWFLARDATFLYSCRSTGDQLYEAA